ncbi:MAG: hypothetical protein HC915_16950 [Anaerolineae bacterium]|nr:hypothetical protein [Anaerolineae bacterium]
MGDSGVVVGNESVAKVHIHVDDPGVPISYAIQLGSITDVVVENMHEQYEAFVRARRTVVNMPTTQLPRVEPGQIGVVAVTAGPGFGQLLADLGVAALVEGGQTNNPSTEEILSQIRGLGTNRVLVLPNNKNIILAAEQAAQLSDGVEVVVVPTRTCRRVWPPCCLSARTKPT